MQPIDRSILTRMAFSYVARPTRDFVLAFHEDAPSANGEIDSLVTRRLLTAWRWHARNEPQRYLPPVLLKYTFHLISRATREHTLGRFSPSFFLALFEQTRLMMKRTLDDHLRGLYE